MVDQPQHLGDKLDKNGDTKKPSNISYRQKEHDVIENDDDDMLLEYGAEAEDAQLRREEEERQ